MAPSHLWWICKPAQNKHEVTAALCSKLRLEVQVKVQAQERCRGGEVLEVLESWLDTLEATRDPLLDHPAHLNLAWLGPFQSSAWPVLGQC